MTRPMPSLAEMTPAARRAYLDAYETGCVDGWTRGYEAALADEESFWRGFTFAQNYDRHLRSLSEWLASTPEYATLAERRGEHEKATRTRALLGERGIA